MHCPPGKCLAEIVYLTAASERAEVVLWQGPGTLCSKVNSVQWKQFYNWKKDWFDAVSKHFPQYCCKRWKQRAFDRRHNR